MNKVFIVKNNHTGKLLTIEGKTHRLACKKALLNPDIWRPFTASPLTGEKLSG